MGSGSKKWDPVVKRTPWAVCIWSLRCGRLLSSVGMNPSETNKDMTKIEKLQLNVKTLRVAKETVTGRIVYLKEEIAIQYRFMDEDINCQERFKALSHTLAEAIGALNQLETLIFQYSDEIEEAQRQLEETRG